MTARRVGRNATAPAKLVAKNATTKNVARSIGSVSIVLHSGTNIPIAMVTPAARTATQIANSTMRMRKKRLIVQFALLLDVQSVIAIARNAMRSRADIFSVALFS